jgi:hypothetical protein
MKTLRALVLIFSLCCSLGWLLWCWNDQTSAGSGAMRFQTFEDHTAAVLFAIARVVLTMVCMQVVIVLDDLEEKGFFK